MGKQDRIRRLSPQEAAAIVDSQEWLRKLDQIYADESREDFWAYRRYMDPALKVGFFPHDIAIKLQEFFDRLVAGKRPKLVIMAPPQHGKSRGLHDFVSWVAGKRPDLKVIYSSYSDDLGVAANSFLQRRYQEARYQQVFPMTRISTSNIVTVGAGRYARNSSYLEYVGQIGSFRNTTVEGQITGKGLDLGIIDDPMKGRKEAQSKTIRNNVWMWLMDDFFNRFSEHAGLILTMTRWHVDDPVGRFLEQFPDAIVIRYPAIALSYEDRAKDKHNAVVDPRTPGMPLFPEFKSLEFLNERKAAYTQASWMSLYQQTPIIAGGGMFPIDMINYVTNAPPVSDIRKSIRYWDKAGTEGGGAYTAGVMMHALHDGRYVVTDVQRGQWSSWDREQRIKATAERDDADWQAQRPEIWIEQEPGSGGKESAERTVQLLAGHNVKVDKVTGSKEIRAEPYAAQWQGGNILLQTAKWNEAFMDEHETFPSGTYLDQVDAAAGAFAKLITKKYNYDTSMNWVK